MMHDGSAAQICSDLSNRVQSPLDYGLVYVQGAGGALKNSVAGRFFVVIGHQIL